MDAKRTLDRIIETGASSMLGRSTHAIDLLTRGQARGLARLGKVQRSARGRAHSADHRAGLMELWRPAAEQLSA